MNIKGVTRTALSLELERRTIAPPAQTKPMTTPTDPAYIKGTQHSVLDVDGATHVVQSIEDMLNDSGRVVTTRWIGTVGEVLRQDQTVLVNPLPTIGVEAQV